ncbi:MAG: Fic family protein, partial [Fusobacteriaceae bacterium]
MKIVKLDKDYLEFIRTEKPDLHEFGIGLYLYYKDNNIFIPMTSQKRDIYLRKDGKVDRISESKFFLLGKNSRNGTLLIVDYIYVKPHLIKELTENLTIRSEMSYIDKNKSELIKRVRNQINFSKPHSDKIKKEILEKYLEKFSNRNRAEAIKYTKSAISSMAVLEKIKFTTEQIDDLIDYRVLERVDAFDVETIFNIKNAWKYMINTLFEELSLSFIIKTNEIIAHHQALEVGIIRSQPWSVSGEFLIEPQKPEVLERYLKYILSSNKSVQIKALNLFYRIILNQWFFDGNKRTAFVVANKLLIEAGAGILLVTEETQEEFSLLLYKCYKTRTEKTRERTKEEFFIFLLEK